MGEGKNNKMGHNNGEKRKAEGVDKREMPDRKSRQNVKKIRDGEGKQVIKKKNNNRGNVCVV